jgi:hypothetical protein
MLRHRNLVFSYLSFFLTNLLLEIGIYSAFILSCPSLRLLSQEFYCIKYVYPWGKSNSKVKFILEQATKIQRGNTGIAKSLFHLGARFGCVVNPTPRPLYPRERNPIRIGQEAGWAPGPVWTCAENLDPTGIRSPDRPARSYIDWANPAHVSIRYRYFYPPPPLYSLTHWPKCAKFYVELGFLRDAVTDVRDVIKWNRGIPGSWSR